MKPDEGKFEQLGREAGLFVEKRHRNHGDTFARAGGAFRLLFPKGITPEQVDDALFLSRIWDQMVKVSQGASGDSPYKEILVFALEGLRRDEQVREAQKVVQLRPVSPADLPCDACGRGPVVPTCLVCAAGDVHTVLASDIEKAMSTCTACTLKLAAKVEPSLPDHSGPIPGDLLTTNELLQPRTPAPNGTPK